MIENLNVHNIVPVIESGRNLLALLMPVIGAVIVRANKGFKFKDLQFDKKYGVGKTDGGRNRGPKLGSLNHMNYFFIPHGSTAQADLVNSSGDRISTIQISDTVDDLRGKVEAVAGVVVVELDGHSNCIYLNRDQRKENTHGAVVEYWAPEQSPKLQAEEQDR